MNKFLTAFAALIAVSAASYGPARADDLVVHTTRVSYADLDLRSPAGVATLRHRLTLASRNVCGDGLEMAVTSDELACRNEAIAHALADMRRLVASAQARPGTALASNIPN